MSELQHFSFNIHKFFQYINQNGKEVMAEGFDIDKIDDSFSVATTFRLDGQEIMLYGENFMGGQAYQYWMSDGDDDDDVDIFFQSGTGTTDVFYYQDPNHPTDVYFVRREVEGLFGRSYHKTSIKMLEFLKEHG